MRQRTLILALALPLVASSVCFAGWDEGVAAFKAKNYPQAAKEFAQVVHDRADWAGGYLMLGRSQLLMGRATDAMTTLRKAYDLDPSSIETELALAQAYIEANRPADSAQLLNKVNVASVPKERQALFQQLRAKAAADSGNTDRAAAELAKAAATSPNDASVQFNYGVMALNSGDTAAAVTALDRAVRLDPNDPDKRKLLVQALVRQGRESQGPAKAAAYSKAADAAKTLASRDSSFDNLLLLGESQLGAGQYDAAIATLRQASAKNAAPWLPYFYTGQAMTAQAKYGDAETALKSALSHVTTAGDKQRVLKQLGFVYEKKKDYDAAKAAYQGASDSSSVARIEANQQIAANNAKAEEEAKKVAELKAQQEKLRQQLQQQGAPPPPR